MHFLTTTDFSEIVVKVYLIIDIFQSLSENELGVVGAMVVDEVLNTNTWLTHLNLSGKMF